LSPASVPNLLVGQVFAGFRIEAILGSGGMGTVYRALDISLDHERALKVLTPNLTNDSAFRERFQRESRMAAQLEDDGVVPIYGAGEADGRLYIAMRLVRGPDLHRLVDDEGPLDPARAVAITAAVASALDAAHARGIIHRDVKPANILVEPGRDGDRTFLTDFGISRPETETTEITSTGQLLGTPDYISPEQIDGARADARADVYALGCVVCFLLTGEAPFARDTPVATLYAHAHAERPRPSLLEPSLPTAVDDVLARATAIDPSERYASAGELAGDLGLALDPASSPATSGRGPVTPRTRELPRSPGSNRRLGLGLVALAAVAIAVAAVLLWPSDDDTAPDETTPVAATTKSIEIGERVSSIVVGDVNVLAASQSDSTLSTIDPGTDEPGTSPREVANPTSVAVGFGSVWVTSGSSGQLLRYAAGHRTEPIQIEVGSNPVDVAVGNDWVWVANRADGTVTQVDPARNTVKATLQVAPGPQSVATSGDVTWIASPASGRLTRIDSSADEATAEQLNFGGRPADLAIVGDSLWEVDPAHGQLLRRSLDDGGTDGDPIDIGGGPVALAVGPGALWVADKAHDLAIRVDLADTAAQERVQVGNRPVALAVGAGSVWVANAGDRTVTRIDR
jgi:serine/threonine protein kinase